MDDARLDSKLSEDEVQGLTLFGLTGEEASV